MNMQCHEEFINEHTGPDSGHGLDFLYQTEGIILSRGHCPRLGGWPDFAGFFIYP